ncbi:unnamed protein product [Moneuplotes crassus]|uniref:Uncharacterized protein n=1 Tax=Euplotes crassus TaxID=5936 RepID=A0AAD1XPS1_EUPCR|nr:unnamed protein product [Moneuplotes crassus]
MEEQFGDCCRLYESFEGGEGRSRENIELAIKPICGILRRSPIKLKKTTKLPLLNTKFREGREKILEKKFKQHMALNKIKHLKSKLQKKSFSIKISNTLLSSQKPIFVKNKKLNNSVDRRSIPADTNFSIKTLEHVSSKSPIKCLRDLHKEKLRAFKSRVIGAKRANSNLSCKTNEFTNTPVMCKIHEYNSSFSGVRNSLFEFPEENSPISINKRRFSNKAIRMLRSKKHTSLEAYGNKNATFKRNTPMLIRGDSPMHIY